MMTPEQHIKIEQTVKANLRKRYVAYPYKPRFGRANWRIHDRQADETVKCPDGLSWEGTSADAHLNAEFLEQNPLAPREIRKAIHAKKKTARCEYKWSSIDRDTRHGGTRLIVKRCAKRTTHQSNKCKHHRKEHPA